MLKEEVNALLNNNNSQDYLYDKTLVMKKLGLIGGMGPQSTVPYYMNIVYGVQEQTSKDFFPNLTIESLNVFEILKMIGDEDYDKLVEHFVTGLQNLKNAGAELGALTANTAHIVFDRLREVSPVPLISLIEAVRDEIIKRDMKTVGLLGTSFTMERDFYRRPLEEAGIKVVVPNSREREYINHKILVELEYGRVETETRRGFIDIVSRMVSEDGIEAIILGCTELPMVLDDTTSPVSCLDTVKIHSDALIRHILND